MTAASAQPPVVIDFESLPGGGAPPLLVPITTEYQSMGVIFEAIPAQPPAGNHATRLLKEGMFGLLNFGNSAVTAMDIGDHGERTRIRFVDPGTASPRGTRYVSLRLGDGNPDQETVAITVFDASWSPIYSLPSMTLDTAGYTFEYSSPAPVIGGLEVYLINSASGCGLDDLRFGGCCSTRLPPVRLDFETLPSGGAPPLQTPITTEYQSLGVIFEAIPAPGGRNNATRLVQQGMFGVMGFGNSPITLMDIGDYGEGTRIRFVDPLTALPQGRVGVSLRLGDGDPASETFAITVFDVSWSPIHVEPARTLTTTGYTFEYSSNAPVIGGLEVYLAPNSVSGCGMDDLTLGGCQPDLGFQGPGAAVACLCGLGLYTGTSSIYKVTGAKPWAPGALLVSIPGAANFTLFPSANPGVLVSGTALFLAAPIIADSTGTVSITFSGLGAPLELVIQSVFVDPDVIPHNVAFTNAVLAQFR